MIIKLYKTLSEDNALDKALTTVAEIDIKILATATTTTFDLTLSGDIRDVNYMYVPAWGKYYFLKAPRVERNGLVRYSASIDVLMTYKAQIREETGIILRQENEGNLYIADSSFPVENRNKMFFKKFPKGFDELLNYYLVVGV